MRKLLQIHEILELFQNFFIDDFLWWILGFKAISKQMQVYLRSSIEPKYNYNFLEKSWVHHSKRKLWISKPWRKLLHLDLQMLRQSSRPFHLSSLLHQLQIQSGTRKAISLERESGWYSGKKLDFHPSNLGSTPARVKYHKKRSNPPRLP